MNKSEEEAWASLRRAQARAEDSVRRRSDARLAEIDHGLKGGRAAFEAARYDSLEARCMDIKDEDVREHTVVLVEAGRCFALAHLSWSETVERDARHSRLFRVVLEATLNS